MRETNDGFVIAERDLELRGPGELLGTRQTGLAEFRVADLQLDHGFHETKHMADACFSCCRECVDPGPSQQNTLGAQRQHPHHVQSGADAAVGKHGQLIAHRLGDCR